MQSSGQKDIDWLFPLKNKILAGIIVILSFSMAVTVFFIVMTLRNDLLNNSAVKTRELGNAVKSSVKKLMLMRTTGMIQNTLEEIKSDNSSILRAFILNRSGKVKYSSDKREIGQTMDRLSNISCTGCHHKDNKPPSQSTIILEQDGKKIHRNIMVIYNEKSCYGCHPESQRINGKLIIDQSLESTYSLISRLELIIFGSGFVCFCFLLPFISAFLNKYIREIISQNADRTFLYNMIERLSKSIEMDELKHITMDIIKESLDADEVFIIIPKVASDYSASEWNNADSEVTRKKINDGDPLKNVLKRWMGKEFSATEMSEDRKRIYIPLEKNSILLALICVGKTTGTFDSQKHDLITIMAGHITIAFENARLYHMATTDELTGLYTKRHFKYYVEKKFVDYEQFGDKLTLLMIDIDNFKKVNDTYGHVAGDTVLKGVSQCIMASIREDDFAFRYGGEELGVILPASDSKSGRYVAERIRDTVELTIFQEGVHKIKVTVSIGVSTCPEDALNVKDIVLSSDKALYKAKTTGKNRVVLSSEA
ncbi:MAG: GGDEF domain-containing protein [Nitrospirae bacterium]|nr:GGDEF domain-containing protein [Nitrospirota bacterium]